MGGANVLPPLDYYRKAVAYLSKRCAPFLMRAKASADQLTGYP